MAKHHKKKHHASHHKPGHHRTAPGVTHHGSSHHPGHHAPHGYVHHHKPSGHGELDPEGMVMLKGSAGIGGKDPVAHPSHDAANAAHGMPHGCSPIGGYHRQGHDGDEGGMADNVCYED